MKRLLMILVVLVPVASLPAQVGMELAARQGIVVVQDRPFEPAVQLLSEIDAGIVVRLQSLELTTGAGVAYQPASPLSASGIQYRGLVLRTAWLGGSYGFGGAVSVGAQLRATLATYELTSLLFFYPEARVAVELSAQQMTGAPIVFDLWTGYQFRRDLTLSFTAGIGARFRLVIEPVVQ
jgi:hypothetical protein